MQNLRPSGELERAIGTLAFFQGMWLLSPLWDTFSSTKVYAPFLALPIPEVVWGILLIFIAVLHWSSSRYLSRSIRVFTTFLSMGWSATFAAMLAQSNIIGLGEATYLGIFILSVAARYHLWVSQKYSKELLKQLQTIHDEGANNEWTTG